MNPLEFARWISRLKEELAKLVEEGKMTEEEANRKLREASEQQNENDD
jgi:3-hydroxyacyl-CoA dehydrogenase